MWSTLLAAALALGLHGCACVELNRVVLLKGVVLVNASQPTGPVRVVFACDGLDDPVSAWLTNGSEFRLALPRPQHHETTNQIACTVRSAGFHDLDLRLTAPFAPVVESNAVLNPSDNAVVVVDACNTCVARSSDSGICAWFVATLLASARAVAGAFLLAVFLTWLAAQCSDQPAHHVPRPAPSPPSAPPPRQGRTEQALPRIAGDKPQPLAVAAVSRRPRPMPARPPQTAPSARALRNMAFLADIDEVLDRPNTFAACVVSYK